MEYAIGCDVGGSFVKMGLLSREGALTVRQTVPLPKVPDPEALAEWLAATLLSFRKETRPDDGTVIGAGIGIPGPVKYPEGILFDPPNLPFRGEIPFGEMLKARLPIPVYIDNDATVQALGEAWLGQGKGIRNFLYLALGTGIGGGIVIDGKVYRGVSGMAAEIGHLSIDYRGRHCLCGSRGCLETYASINGIANSLKEFGWELPDAIRNPLKSGQWSKLPGLLKERIDRGETQWRKIWDIFADALGAGMGSLINLFNPERIILSGGLSYYGSLFLSRATETARRYSFRQPASQCRIVVSDLKDRAGIIGAAYLAFDEMPPL